MIGEQLLKELLSKLGRRGVIKVEVPKLPPILLPRIHHSERPKPEVRPTLVNDLGVSIEPVDVNFWWNENGPVEEYTFDGDSYPYTTPPPSERFIMHTTFINEPIKFYAIPSPEQIEKEETFNPQTIPPPGVEVIDYQWDFGDGVIGFGPFVEHEYKFVQPGIEVKLTVVDTRGLLWSRAKPVNLVPRRTGYITKLIPAVI